MGLFDKFKQIFSGGGDDKSGDTGIYVYVKLDRSSEIVRLRLNPGSDINPDYNQGGFVSRKHIIGPKSFKQANAVFRFDNNYRFKDAEIAGGELVSEEEWAAGQTDQ